MIEHSPAWIFAANFAVASLIFCPMAIALVVLSETTYARTIRVLGALIVVVVLASALVSAAQLPNIDWCTRVDGWVWWVNLCFLA